MNPEATANIDAFLASLSSSAEQPHEGAVTLAAFLAAIDVNGTHTAAAHTGDGDILVFLPSINAAGHMHPSGTVSILVPTASIASAGLAGASVGGPLYWQRRRRRG